MTWYLPHDRMPPHWGCLQGSSRVSGSQSALVSLFIKQISKHFCRWCGDTDYGPARMAKKNIIHSALLGLAAQHISNFNLAISGRRRQKVCQSLANLLMKFCTLLLLACFLRVLGKRFLNRPEKACDLTPNNFWLTKGFAGQLELSWNFFNKYKLFFSIYSINFRTLPFCLADSQAHLSSSFSALASFIKANTPTTRSNTAETTIINEQWLIDASNAQNHLTAQSN